MSGLTDRVVAEVRRVRLAAELSPEELAAMKFDGVLPRFESASCGCFWSSVEEWSDGEITDRYVSGVGRCSDHVGGAR